MVLLHQSGSSGSGDLVIAAALAVIAGSLYGLDKSFRPFIYFQLLLPIFASAVVGGLGSPLGAIAGAYIVAFSEVIVTYAWKKVLVYLLPALLAPDGLMQLLSLLITDAVSFSDLIIVLLFMPTWSSRGNDRAKPYPFSLPQWPCCSSSPAFGKAGTSACKS